MNITNIIRGVVNATKYTVTAPIIKEDYGLYLKIEGLDLPAVYEVDFSNSENSGTSVTMVGNADGVLIPRQFIKSGQDVFAFLYWNGEDFGRTVYKFRIPNKLRPDRTEEQPTPEEQSLIDQAINALNTAVEQTAADVETTTAKAAEATAAAQTATQKASEATESAQSAGTYATRAETAQIAAETARTASQQSATASATSAESAAESAVDALDAAEDALASATAAAQSASSAGQSALDARDYKDAANLSAESASEYAGAASDSATTATEQALIATNKASESAQSALDASTAKDDAVTAKNAAETAQNGAEVARTGAENAETNANATVHGILENLDLTETSGAIVETADAFPAGAERMTVKINPVQDLSQGDPSPTNVCPISGWTGMNVQRAGKNLYDIKGWLDKLSVIYTESNGYISFTPTSPCYSSFFELPSGTKTLSFNFSNESTATNLRFRVKYADGTIDSNATTTKTGNIVGIALNWRTVGVIKVRAQVELGSTATDYEPYTGQTFPISFGEAGTVYSGILDVVNGVLTVDRIGKNVPDDNGWKRLSTEPRAFYRSRQVVAPDMFMPVYQSTYLPVSNMYKYQIDGTLANGAFRISDALYIVDDRFDSVEEFRNSVLANGLQLVYELAEPIVYHIDPTQISLLKDYNLLWADTGDITDFAYRIGELASKATTDNHEQRISAIEEILPTKAPIIEDTATGAVASFPDGADDVPIKSLKVAINPVQDLHGYDSPWPAGGGKNLLNFIAETATVNGITFTVNSDGTISATGTATANAVLIAPIQGNVSIGENYILNGCPTGGGQNTYELMIIAKNNNAGYGHDYGSGVQFTYDDDQFSRIQLVVRSGNTVNIVFKPMIRLTSETDATFAPYSNICPISGRTGVNVFNDPVYGGNIVFNQLVQNGNFANTDGWVANNGTLSASSNVGTYTPTVGTYARNFATSTSYATESVVGHKYLYSFYAKATDVSLGNFVYNPLNNGLITKALTANVDTLVEGIVTISTATNGRFFFYPWGTAGNITATGSESFMIRNVMCFDLTAMFGVGNEPSTVDAFRALFYKDYYAYNAGTTTTVSAVNGDPYTNIPISWQTEAGTVYGGTLDVVSGELVVDKASVDLGTLNWTSQSSESQYSYYSNVIDDIKPPISNSDKGNIISQIYPVVPTLLFVVAKGDAKIGLSTSKRININDNRYPTKTDFTTAMSGVQLVYELATPIVYHLTPTEVRTLLGQNNVFADTGNSTVEYYADTKLYIDKRISELVNS